MARPYEMIAELGGWWQRNRKTIEILAVVAAAFASLFALYYSRSAVLTAEQSLLSAERASDTAQRSWVLYDNSAPSGVHTNGHLLFHLRNFGHVPAYDIHIHAHSDDPAVVTAFDGESSILPPGQLRQIATNWIPVPAPSKKIWFTVSYQDQFGPHSSRGCLVMNGSDANEFHDGTAWGAD